jgi:tetratricopeptide (TPR) repeat protein
MGRHEDALPHWQEAVRLEPGFVPSWVALAETLTRLGRREAAESVVARLREIAPDEAERIHLQLYVH